MSTPALIHQLRDDFIRRFGRSPTVVARAPGRVNLIGEHTDYNDGYVLPMALEQSTWVAAAPRADGLIQAFSQTLQRDARWPIDHWRRDTHEHWTAYVAGVAALLKRRALSLSGADLLVHSSVPAGGGLSSSAALEVASALALSTLAASPLSGAELADLCRAAEHDYAGVPCGIMDQFVSVLARPDCALLLDCRTRAWQHVPLQLGEHIILVVDSGVRHELAAGEYARRQEQCRQAVAYFRRLDPRVVALRDVDAATLATHTDRLPPAVAARARHVISENQRTLAAAEALQRSDLRAFGQLMLASHASLRDDYQVSCHELDHLVEIVSGVAGVCGARMTGGGFGGCIVAIAHQSAAAVVGAAVQSQYDAAGYGPAKLLICRPGPGAEIVFNAAG